MNSTHSRSRRPGPLGPARATLGILFGMTAATALILQRAIDGLAYVLVERGAKNLEEARSRGLVTDDRELGNVITDNLGMIVFGILAIVVIGGLISGLGTTVINWVTNQLGV